LLLLLGVRLFAIMAPVISLKASGDKSQRGGVGQPEERGSDFEIVVSGDQRRIHDHRSPRLKSFPPHP
jgi:hypothetical protein